MNRLWITAVLLLGSLGLATTRGAGQGITLDLPTDPKVRAQAEIDAGHQALQAAGKTNQVEAVAGFLQRAIMHYDRALQIAPGHYRAQLLRGVALAQLSLTAPSREKVVEVLRQAAAQFQQAAESPERDAVVYLQWSALLLDRLYPLTPPADHAVLLRDAVEVIRSGLATEPQASVEAALRLGLGRCYVYQGMAGGASAEATERFRAAIVEFARPEVSRILEANAMFGQLDGVALLKVGIAANDPALLERSVQRFEQVLFREPKLIETRYNLACAYAQLGRLTEALVQLRLVLDADARGQLLPVAENDPDLAPLRETDGFRELVTARRVEQQKRQALALVAQARDRYRQAIATNDMAVTVQELNELMPGLQEAISLQPGLYEAQSTLGQVAADLAGLTREPQLRRRWMMEARDRFKLAADCEGAQAAVFEAWATLLLRGHQELEGDPAGQIALLTEAAAVCERGLRLARFSGETARLQASRGSALVMQALIDKDPDHQKSLYREAITQFEAARSSEHLTKDSSLYSSWGIALLKLGQLTRDKLMIRLATERFQSAIDQDEKNYAAHYNNACAYAALAQADAAMRHLRVCLASEQSGRYRQSALHDPDFDPIRHTDAYKAVFGERLQLDQLIQPRISGR